VELNGLYASECFHLTSSYLQGAIQGSIPPETYESNFIRHDFLQFGKQHPRYKDILYSIVLSQQCCEAVAARGEIGRKGCEHSSLVEHMGLSPWLFL